MLTPRRFLFRSLSHYRGIHLSVALGVAVGTAVLSGALLVGDSVRGSLRDLTLDRLGAIDHAMVTDRYFREDLAEDLAEATNFAYAFDRAAPAVLIRGSVEAASSGARASRVNIHGIDERFASFYKEPLPLPKSREVVLNESLAREVGAAAGDSVLLRFQTDTLVPSESVMGRKGDNVRTLRLTVASVVPNRGPGRFGLSPSQQLPFNAYLPLDAVQRALDQNGRANALFVAGSDADAQQLNGILRDVLTLGDLNLSTRNLSTQGLDESFSLGTDRIVLEIPVAEAALRAAEKANLEAMPILTYLANTLRAGDREIPYSTVTAIGLDRAAPNDSLLLLNGAPAPSLTGDEMLLNEWAARDLNASVGDAIEMSYYVVGAGGALDTATHRFSLKGIVRLGGLAADRHLAPDYKGMSDTERMGDWDPPFPVDLTKIRAIDEDYWERYRSAPKAFVSLDTAKSLWTSRFGQLTSIRFTPRGDQTIEKAQAAFREAFLRELDPAVLGLAFQPVKAQGLEASSGATDFSGLFIGFSSFLIVSAAMLVTLLFRLGVERRAKEIGLLLATGHPVASVRKLLLEEGTLISLAGCLVGLPAAVGYGALMVHGLRTWWSAAVGGSFLELHVGTLSLLLGTVGAFLMMVVSIWLSLWRLHRFSPRSMLAGALEEERSVAATERAARRPQRLAYGSAASAVALLGLSLAKVIPDVAALGTGALLLVAAIAAFRATLVGGSRGLVSGGGSTPLLRLGARNASRYPTRSVLSVALVASATFLIVTVAVNRHDVTSQEPAFQSGNGGFRFVAESDLPIYSGPLDSDNGEAEGEPANAPKVYPLRAKPGEDASCLNLYRPSRPTLLGATAELIERGGFAFGGTLAEFPEEEANPWLILNRDLPGDAIPVFGDANSVQWILHLGLGQELDWTDGRGRSRKLVIAGLMPRSLFQSQLVMSEKHFLELFPDRGGYNFFLIESDQPGAGTQLEEQLADQGFDATRTADRLAGYLVVENTYLNTFQTLGGLGLLLGMFGLAVVMIRSVLERRGELALLQAVGFNRSSISWLVLAENGFLLLFGIAIGTVTALLAVLPHLLSGMAEPPWAALSATLLLILGVGLVAGAAAVAASLRSPLTPALRGQ